MVLAERSSVQSPRIVIGILDCGVELATTAWTPDEVQGRSTAAALARAERHGRELPVRGWARPMLWCGLRESIDTPWKRATILRRHGRERHAARRSPPGRSPRHGRASIERIPPKGSREVASSSLRALEHNVLLELACFWTEVSSMDFIEKFFGVSPDGGDGTLEVLWLVAGVTAVAGILFRRRIFRFARSSDRSHSF